MSKLPQPQFEPLKIGKLLHFGVRDKLMIVSLLAVTLALVVSGWLLLERQRAHVFTDVLTRTPQLARVVGIGLTSSVLGFDYHAIQQILDETVAADGIVYARVENAKGITMAEAGVRPVSQQDSVVAHHAIRYEGVAVGRLELIATAHGVGARIDEELRYLTTNMALIIVFVFVAEFLAIAWYVNRPLRRISVPLRAGLNEKGEMQGPRAPFASDEFGEWEARFAALCDTLNASHRQVQTQMVESDRRLLEANQKLVRQALELKVKNEELQALSLTDPLTGLYNRRQFENFIEAELSLALRHGEDLSLFMLDLDHFKRVNDTYGHNAGDHVLKQVAQILRNVVRKSDVLCRIGGEEFVVLGKHLKRVDALGVAEKIRSSVEKMVYEVDGQRFNVTISIGIASVPCPFEMKSATDFFKAADQALYYCKQHGRNRVAHFMDISPRDALTARPTAERITHLQQTEVRSDQQGVLPPI